MVETHCIDKGVGSVADEIIKPLWRVQVELIGIAQIQCDLCTARTPCFQLQITFHGDLSGRHCRPCSRSGGVGKSL